MTLLLRELLDAAPLSTEEALRILRRPTAFVVITEEENRKLDNAGVGQSAWDPANPLGRYKAAGLDTAEFHSLSDELP
jgi:hypothetical protein